MGPLVFCPWRTCPRFISLRLRACLQMVATMQYEHLQTLSQRPDRRPVGANPPPAAQGDEGGPPGRSEPARPPQRHLLPPAHRLPVASAAPRGEVVGQLTPRLPPV